MSGACDRLDARAERRGQRLCAVSRAPPSLSPIATTLAIESPPLRSARSTGAIATAMRPPSQQTLGGVADRDVAFGGVRVRAEHDHVGALGLGERREALGGRAVGDDVTPGTGLTEQADAAVEELLRLVLGDRLAGAVDLGAVADVGERHLGAGAGEQSTESDRVVLVGGAVVGNDDLGTFGVSPVWV